MKYLIWLLVLAGAVFWWSAGRRREARRPPPVPPPPPQPTPLPQTMARCAHCGMHLPLADAVRRDEFAYCSAAHADAGPPEGRP